MHLLFCSGNKKSCEKGFSGIESRQGDDCGDVYTSLLCKRLHYVLSVNRIHNQVFLSVNQIQTTRYDYFYDSHSIDANGQMTYYDWSIYINSLNLSENLRTLPGTPVSAVTQLVVTMHRRCVTNK
jgi:hypothetical protein